MSENKIIVFKHYENAWNIHEEEMEFDIDESEEMIQECFEDWVWGLIGDSVSWYEK